MKYVYAFKEGNKDMRELLGGKGANIAEMRRLNLPVPNGFTVTTEACNKYYQDDERLSNEILDEIKEHIKELEIETGKILGDPSNPLLLSVRSGSRASMPGMMDTILNLGINDEVAKGFSIKTGNERFVYDSYRRFIQMFSDVAMSLPKGSFEKIFSDIKKYKGVTLDTELTSNDLRQVVEIYKEEYRRLANEEFPTDPLVQLERAVKAVFRSWNNERAITYRKLNNIPNSWGTAVNVQEMVYGNSGEKSGTGVAFTRNPANGKKELFGEFLLNAQGEDVVAGIRTPQTMDKLKELFPDCYEEFVRISDTLEHHYKDMQDMEFTIDNSKFYILQTRNGKRTGEAAINIAVDLVNEGMITKEEAIMKVDASLLDQLLHPVFKEESLKKAQVVARGLAASPGAATGKIYFDSKDLKKAKENGEKELILVRLDTSPEDIEAMLIAEGILTIHGGMTSHAAVVARGIGVCCVSGCSEILIDEENKTLTLKDGRVLKEGDYLSLNGSTGEVYAEHIEKTEKEITGNFSTFMSWVDMFRRLKVKANADTKKDALIANRFNAEGIGLCRTEHMFFNEERIFNFRKMILSSSLEEREEHIKELLKYQRDDFKELFNSMPGKSVVIRLLDPPIHEFLPKQKEEIEVLAKALNVSYETLMEKIASLKEFNPMMGHRGSRLLVSYPEIARMQARAILEALSEVEVPVDVQIMIPLILEVKEYSFIKNIIDQEAKKVMEERRKELKYKVGTMIEVPRAVVLSREIGEKAEFFSYGTNDLTQMTFGMSRDDSSKFLDDYLNNNILSEDPFKHIDEKGVGQLIILSKELGRRANPNLELGICGEHGGDPQSIEFFNKIGLDYVSCSPYRIPIAKLAAAQAEIKKNKENK